MRPLGDTIFFSRKEIRSVRKTRGENGCSSVYRQSASCNGSVRTYGLRAILLGCTFFADLGEGGKVSLKAGSPGFVSSVCRREWPTIKMERPEKYAGCQLDPTCFFLRTDPLGTQALWGVLLGALNIGASLLVVMSRPSQKRCMGHVVHLVGRKIFIMKSPEFNIALSNAWEVLTSGGSPRGPVTGAQSLLSGSSGAPREVAPVSADRARSRASIDE